MPELVADLRAQMTAAGRVFGDLDRTTITHPLVHYGGDTDALTRRVKELNQIGFQRVLLTLPSDHPDNQWKPCQP